MKIELNNKNKHAALLILRHKSDSTARNICERARIIIPSVTGKLFWNWIQTYIYAQCKPDHDFNITQPVSGDNSITTSLIAAPSARSLSQIEYTYGPADGTHSCP